MASNPYTSFIKKTSCIAMLAVLLVSCGENNIMEPSLPGDGDIEDAEMDVDSTSSHFTFEYEYNDNVVEMSDKMAAYLDDASNTVIVHPEVIYFKSDMPDDMIPQKGQSIVIKPDTHTFVFGYIGNVVSVDKQKEYVAVYVEDAELNQIYRNLNMDVLMNAEQMLNTTRACAVYGDADMETQGQDDFFSGADACLGEYANWKHEHANNATPGIEQEATDGLFAERNGTAKPRAANKPWYDNIELKASKKELVINVGDMLRFPIYRDFKMGASGSIKIKPVSVKCRTVIENSVTTVSERKETWDLEFSSSVDMIAALDTLTRLRSGKYLAIVPIPSTPLFVEFHAQNSIGLYGEAALKVGTTGKLRVILSTTTANDVTSDFNVSTNFGWAKGPVSYFSKFTVSGGVAEELRLATNVLGFPFALSAKPKIQFGGSVDLADPYSYAQNPQMSLDVSCPVGIYHMRDMLDFTKEGMSVWLNKDNSISVPVMPVFPKIDDPSGVHKKGSTTGTLRYNSDSWYFLYPMLQSGYASMHTLFVQDEWRNNPSDSYIADNTVPKDVRHKGTATLYSATGNGLTASGDYYAVPTFDIHGLSNYYAKPIRLMQNEELRLCLIGPDYNAEVDGERLYLAMGYDEEGRVKRINNTVLQTETYVSRNPLSVKTIEYNFECDKEDRYYKKYDIPTYWTDFNLDKKTGVVKSLRWHDLEDHGVTKFYYDDGYHLTGMSDSGTDGWTTTTLEWDDRGCLTKIYSRDSDGAYTTIDYTYRDDDKFANPQGTWSLATGYIFDGLAFGRIIGKAPSHLPVSMHITDVTKDSDGKYTTSTEGMNISYKIAGRLDDQYIESEKWTTRLTTGDRYSFTFPYTYRSISLSDEQIESDRMFGATRSASQSDGSYDGLRRLMKQMCLPWRQSSRNGKGKSGL